MAYIKQYHADTHTTYVYESKSYWDREKGQPRSVRKLIGKLDPETGEVVATGKRGRKASHVEAAKASVIDDRISELTISVRKRDERIAELESENKRLRDALIKLENHTVQYLENIRHVLEKRE